MQRKINFEVIKIKKKMEPMQLSVIVIKCHRLGKRRPSDQNSSKHENSNFELGGPVFTPKFGKEKRGNSRLIKLYHQGIDQV